MAGAILGVLIIAHVALATPVEGIFSRVESPLAVRGGVLMLPLAARVQGDAWPNTMRLRLDNGTTIDGQVVWVSVDDTLRAIHWTDDPRRLAVRPIQILDDSSDLSADGVIGPVLLARLPADGWGNLQLQQQRLTPRWLDASPPAAGRDVPRLPIPRPRTPDVPAPDAPFDAWRWSLLADAAGLRTPRFTFDAPAQMVATHFIDLWQAGLARLEQADADVADRCRKVLTRTCTDRGRPIAAWAADPAGLNELLSLLTTVDREDAQLAAEVGAWLDRRSPLLFWAESEASDHVRLAALNTSSSRVVARFTWVHTPDIPIAVPIDPGVLVHMRLERAEPPERLLPGRPAPASTASHILHVEIGPRQFRMDFRSPTIDARPPVLAWAPFAAPLTLAELQQRLQRVMPADHATRAELRRRDGRWEVFFECHRPRRAAEAAIRPRAILDTAVEPDEVRGIESVTLYIGPEFATDASGVALTIPEQGAHRLFRGTLDDTLEIHRHSYRDLWFCRVVIPDAWLLPVEGPFVSFAGLRSHADLDQVETSPHASVPWAITTGRLAVDLSGWTDLPRTDSSTSGR